MDIIYVNKCNFQEFFSINLAYLHDVNPKKSSNITSHCPKSMCQVRLLISVCSKITESNPIVTPMLHSTVPVHNQSSRLCIHKQIKFTSHKFDNVTKISQSQLVNSQYLTNSTNIL